MWGPELDPGELESIAILANDSAKTLRFCAADRAAIISVALLGLEERGMSLEAALGGCGMGRKLGESRHLEKRFRAHISDGKLLLVGNKKK